MHTYFQFIVPYEQYSVVVSAQTLNLILRGNRLQFPYWLEDLIHFISEYDPLLMLHAEQEWFRDSLHVSESLGWHKHYICQVMSVISEDYIAIIKLGQ